MNRKLLPKSIILLCLFSSCVSTKKYQSFTREKVNSLHQASNATKPDYLEIKWNGGDTLNDLVRIRKLKSFFITLLVYTQIENSKKAEIHPKVVTGFFESDFIKLADSLDLRSKLGGKKLEITITQIPNSFVYRFQETVVFLLLAYTTTGQEAIYPDRRSFKLDFRVIEDGSVVMGTDLEMPGHDRPVSKVWKSSKNFTRAYLEQYRKSITVTTKEVYDKIQSVIEKGYY